MKKLIFGLFLTLFLSAVVVAQENRLGNQPISSSEIYQNIEKLGFLGSALFIAAHPDDENTRLIAWLDNQKMARTAYLSLTRGDGGQNLIGPELREQLGMIRTQELLEARPTATIKTSTFPKSDCNTINLILESSSFCAPIKTVTHVNSNRQYPKPFMRYAALLKVGLLLEPS